MKMKQHYYILDTRNRNKNFNNNNKTNLDQSSSTYTQFMRPTAISPKEESKNTNNNKDISSTNVI